jgi:hypothetical protein
MALESQVVEAVEESEATPGTSWVRLGAWGQGGRKGGA